MLNNFRDYYKSKDMYKKMLWWVLHLCYTFSKKWWLPGKYRSNKLSFKEIQIIPNLITIEMVQDWWGNNGYVAIWLGRFNNCQQYVMVIWTIPTETASHAHNFKNFFKCYIQQILGLQTKIRSQFTSLTIPQ